MYRKFLLLAVAALTVLPAVSQKMKRHEVSVSYGYAPVFNRIDDYRLLTGQFLSSTYKCNFLGADNKQ